LRISNLVHNGGAQPAYKCDSHGAEAGGDDHQRADNQKQAPTEHGMNPVPGAT